MKIAQFENLFNVVQVIESNDNAISFVDTRSFHQALEIGPSDVLRLYNNSTNAFIY